MTFSLAFLTGSNVSFFLPGIRRRLMILLFSIYRTAGYCLDDCFASCDNTPSRFKPKITLTNPVFNIPELFSDKVPQLRVLQIFVLIMVERIHNSQSKIIGQFPSSLLPLFQNESKCETFHMKMSFTHKSIRMQIILIFI